MAPVSGSAYSYAYLAFGELIAFVIGWDLILEYALQAATVSAGWSGHFGNKLLEGFGLHLPVELTAACRHRPGRHHLLQPARFRHRAHHHVGALHRHQPDQAHQ